MLWLTRLRERLDIWWVHFNGWDEIEDETLEEATADYLAHQTNH